MWLLGEDQRKNIIKTQVYNWHVSIYWQTTCSNIIRDVHLWGQKRNTTIAKATTQQPQLQMFVFHVHQPTYFAWFLWSSVQHIGTCKCPKFMCKSKCTLILVLLRDWTTSSKVYSNQKKNCTKVGGVGNGSHIVIIYTNFCVIEHGMFLLFEISEFYHVCGFNFIF